MKGNDDTPGDSLKEQIREMGGVYGGADTEEVSDAELAFLEHVLAWETGPFSTHRAWLPRSERTFMPPAELFGPRMKTELWRLIRALAEARVFLYHTNTNTHDQREENDQAAPLAAANHGRARHGGGSVDPAGERPKAGPRHLQLL